MILVKNWHFCQSMFFLSKRQNRLFDYVLDRKDRFLDYKNVLFTRSKNCIFAKGLTYDFAQKLAFLTNYVFSFQIDKVLGLIKYFFGKFVSIFLVPHQFPLTPCNLLYPLVTSCSPLYSAVSLVSPRNCLAEKFAFLQRD